MQGLYHLRNSATVERNDAERIIQTYSYATVRASWEGRYDGHTGTYFVLEGEAHVREATVERLASGLYWASHVMDLT